MDIQLELKILEFADNWSGDIKSADAKVERMGEIFRKLAGELGYKIERCTE